MFKYALILLFPLWVPLACASQNDIEVLKKENPEYHETVYAAKGDGCVISWLVHQHTEPRGMGISELSQCQVPIVLQSPYRMALLKKVIADTNHLEGMLNFSWGRMRRDDATDAYTKRLTQAVATWDHWDKTKGTLTDYKKSQSAYFSDLLNQKNVFSEVVAVFASQGFVLRVNGVENVLITNAEPIGNKLEKLPFDCTVTFSVKKK